MSSASWLPAGPFASKSHGPMFFDDITSMMGEKAAYSVHRSSSRAFGVSGKARYPPRSAVHSGMPLSPAPRPAVTTVGSPFRGEKLGPVSPPHRKPSSEEHTSALQSLTQLAC